MTAIVELRGITRTFATTPPIEALRSTTLTIRAGEYVAIVGPSGSGKSTLLHLLGLLDQPTEGTYLIDGIDTSALSDPERASLRGSMIGFVFQTFHLLPYRSAIENVMLAGTYIPSSRHARHQRAAEVLAQVGLRHRSAFMPNIMSGGEQQRVAIARALFSKPRIILADEPTGNLDSDTSESILDVFDNLNQRGHTIIVVTHSAAVSSRARRRINIQDGKAIDEIPVASPASHLPSAPAPVQPAVIKGKMKIGDLLTEAIAGVVAKPMRTVLTVSGTVLGIAALVSTLGLAKTAGSQIASRFDELAATEVVVVQVVNSNRLDRNSDPPPQRLPWDADVRLSELNGVRGAGTFAPVNVGERRVSAVTAVDPKTQDAIALPVVAASPGLFDAVRAETTTGRWFDTGHDTRADPVAVLGATAAQRLNITRLEHQPAVFIGEDAYTIIGILGGPQRLPGLLTSVIVPNGVARQRYGLATPESVHIDTAIGAALQVAGEALVALAPNAPRELQARLPPEPQRVRNEIARDVQALLLGLGGLSLLVGALGIANTTLVSVLERTSEIGLRRSLGATRHQVGRQFIIETSVLGLLGGVVGTSLGVLIIVSVAVTQEWTPVLDPWLPIVAPLIGAFVGTLAGLYPALRAAHIEPIAALRSST